MYLRGSPHGPDNGAERKSRRRTADPSYHDAQGYITAPPQNAHTTSTATTKNTTVDNITVLASLARILHPIVSAYVASVMSPTLIAAERSSVSERSLRRCRSSSVLLLGEGLAQLLLLLLWQVGGDDLEVVLFQLVDHPLGRVGPASQCEQR